MPIGLSSMLEGTGGSGRMTAGPVTCGGASMGPASGGPPSSRRVMGGGVRWGGPCSSVGVTYFSSRVGVTYFSSSVEVRSGGGPDGAGRPVPVVVVVSSVVVVEVSSSGGPDGAGWPVSTRVMGGGVRRPGPWSSAASVGVWVWVVVRDVVTVTMVVSSADDVVDSVQVSMLLAEPPLTAFAVVVVVALADEGMEIRLGSRVEVMVAVAGPHESRLQL